MSVTAMKLQFPLHILNIYHVEVFVHRIRFRPCQVEAVYRSMFRAATGFRDKIASLFSQKGS